MKKWLNQQKSSTQILYSLLTLAVASDHLALDKYAVFYVCEIARSDRRTAVMVLDHQAALKYLTKIKSTIRPTYQKEIREATDCPPLVKREYKPNEPPTKKADLAVVYKDGISEIPGRWKFKYVEGRALKRDAYKFNSYLTMPTVLAANVLSCLSKNRDFLVEWAKPLREQTETRLRKILQCYGFDPSYQMISDEDFRSSIFAGLALYDSKRSQVHTFETKNVGLSQFLKR